MFTDFTPKVHKERNNKYRQMVFTAFAENREISTDSESEATEIMS